MTSTPIELYLKKLEEWRRREGLSRSATADEMGIPAGTYANWYRTSDNKRSPSKPYTRWIKSFLIAKGIVSVDRFLERDGPDLLRRVGVREGQTVMDFGCGNGDYSLILARAVGTRGRVYAVDKDKGVLYELMGRARGNAVDNIEGTFIPQKTGTPTGVPLPDESIDAGWFCDVLHDGYFEEDAWKKELLVDVRRILKTNGFIAVHAVHMDVARLKTVIGSSRFHLERKYHGEILFHGNEFHEGTVFKFRKVEDMKEKDSAGGA